MHPISDLKLDSSALGIRLIWYAVVTIETNSDAVGYLKLKRKVSAILATKRHKSHVHLIQILNFQSSIRFELPNGGLCKEGTKDKYCFCFNRT
jgi:hypothetical protein